MAEIKKRLGDITGKNQKNEKKLKLAKKKKRKKKRKNKPICSSLGAISWRQQDIKYRKNEIFIDVVEKVNVLLSPKGTVLESGKKKFYCFVFCLLFVC